MVNTESSVGHQVRQIEAHTGLVRWLTTKPGSRDKMPLGSGDPGVY